MAQQVTLSSRFREANAKSTIWKYTIELCYLLVGEDTIENAMALCPNCHREMHYGTLLYGVVIIRGVLNFFGHYSMFKKSIRPSHPLASIPGGS